jgi:hypothetical protein
VQSNKVPELDKLFNEGWTGGQVHCPNPYCSKILNQLMQLCDELESSITQALKNSVLLM